MSLQESLKSISPKTSIPKLEEEVLEFWKKNDVFQKTLDQRKDKEKFTFYDGPPFANGLPHYGHILAMSIKDLFVRFKTMQGYYVPRRNGWDCHGLPVEYQTEKDLGISGKKEIEKYGIAKFNAKARESVFKYKDAWSQVIKRMGRWVDLKHAYATMDKEYIESVWWVFKQLWDKGLVYEDYVSQPFCTRCGTSLSNFETNQGYQDGVKDPSVYIKFKKVETDNEYYLAWTTTPWTLPANLALAIDENVEYGVYQIGDEKLWVACTLSKKLFGDNAKLINKAHGRELIGQKYEPLYPISDYTGNKLEGQDNAYKIYSADFVTLADGTGIVHMAPAYGEDDMILGKRIGLPVVFSCDYNGTMVTEIARGKYIKEADADIIKDLNDRGNLFKSGAIRHTYPFCWRCDSPLIYIAVNSWFVRVSDLKDDLVELNNSIKWQPSHIKQGRFGKWLEGARDWNIARQRYWGAPLPIWQCLNCDNKKVIGSLTQLKQNPDFDPHRPQIDDVKFNCDKCSGQMQRVPEVFDCWFESGSMPYGQWHYPFEKKREFETGFPADFIGEGIDQTRGWFYTMHVLAAALFNESAYKSVVANGILLAEDGRKLSKKLRNYPEPSEVFDDLGADSLRQFLFSATQIGENYYFSKRLVADESRKTVMPLWNAVVFYKNFLKLCDAGSDDIAQTLDEWMESRLNQTIANITKYLEDYDLTRASRTLKLLINEFSVWYLRLSRKRKDMNFKANLRAYTILIAKLCAPFMPFIAEIMYQAVRNDEEIQSVHLANWPKEGKIDEMLIEQMQAAREIVEEALALRAKAGIKVRQPLSGLSYNKNNIKLSDSIEKIILQELNILAIADKGAMQKKITPDIDGKYGVAIDIEIDNTLKKEGDLRELIRAVQEMRKKSDLMPQDEVSGRIAFDGKEYEEDFIAKITQATNCKLEIVELSNLADGQEVLLWDGKAKISLYN